MNIVPYMVALAVGAAATTGVAAQQLQDPSRSEQSRPPRSATTAGLTGGAWATGTSFWPRVAVNADHAFGAGAFAVRAEVWGVSRPIAQCNVPTRDCRARRWMRGVTVGARLIYPKGAWHPYIGAGGGRNWYIGSGPMLYAEGGLRHELGRRWGAELRTSLEILAEDSEASGGDTFNVGFWHAIGH
jgi:hypothetical protein